jgi:hypothetical protein
MTVNLHDENGYVTKGEILYRMHRRRPPRNAGYHMFKPHRSDFAHVCVTAGGVHGKPLFKIYAATPELYEYVRGLYHEVAIVLQKSATSENWRSFDGDDAR